MYGFIYTYIPIQMQNLVFYLYNLLHSEQWLCCHIYIILSFLVLSSDIQVMLAHVYWDRFLFYIFSHTLDAGLCLESVLTQIVMTSWAAFHFSAQFVPAR